jgi:hypothetical protein
MAQHIRTLTALVDVPITIDGTVRDLAGDLELGGFWTWRSGPGEVTLANGGVTTRLAGPGRGLVTLFGVETTVSFSQPGRYVFDLAGGTSRTSATLTVKVRTGVRTGLLKYIYEGCSEAEKRVLSDPEGSGGNPETYQKFMVARNLIEHEDNVISHRMTWLMMGESFLFSGFVNSSSNKAEKTLLAAFGIVVALISYVAILNGIVQSLKVTFLRQASPTDSVNRGQVCCCFSPCPFVPGLLLYAPVSIPPVIVLFWIGFLINLYVNETTQDVNIVS